MESNHDFAIRVPKTSKLAKALALGPCIVFGFFHGSAQLHVIGSLGQNQDAIVKRKRKTTLL